MQTLCPRPEEHAAIRTDLNAIFVSLELSRSTWVITSLAPGSGEKMSKHSVRSGDIAGLLARLSQLKEKARARTGHVFPIIVIQEAGLDGFWIHRVLQKEGIESHVVDPASIATSRRRRHASSMLNRPPRTAQTTSALRRITQRMVSGGGRSAIVSTLPSGPMTYRT